MLILTATGALLWFSLNSIHAKEGQTKFGFILEVWALANKPLMFLSAFVAILSHLIRAERWRLILNPLDFKIKLSHSFMSVMVGYFVNLVIPRGGELSRCYNLYRLNKTPINVSFGTVIVERLVDVVFLLSLITISFFIEIDNLFAFFKSLNIHITLGHFIPKFSTVFFIIIIGTFLILSARFLLIKKKRVFLKFLVKLFEIINGMKEGGKAILKLEKRGLFILYSLLIWVCYYLMSYFVMLAFPDTENLTLLAALTIFVIGGIAMAIPLPGGTGSYHVMVPAGLVFLYAIPQDKAVAFTVIFHGWQTVLIILVGASSLLISQVKAKHKIYEKNKG